MIRVWRHVLRPLVEAIEGRVILEIGAEFGKSTQVLINYVREVEGHLHCIDPVPIFDAEGLKRDNADVLTFYQDLSLNVLADIHPVDVAMVDGDHNWYTVYNELKMIEAAHGHDALRQPLLFCHDIGWPYGRRDLYYDPSTLPAEFVNEHAREGILPNRDELVPGRGMNLDLLNARRLGGPRNGVLTGVEDYMAESALNFRFLELPFFYGLGILITEERLAANEALRAEVEKLEKALAGRELLALSEHLRVVEGIVLQSLSRKLNASEERIAELEQALEELKKA
ncbi:MAG: class I SAM-dependent methyltransferase [Pseudomonadota bacterium]